MCNGWGSYNKYECEHALCNAHLKRELTGIEENFEQQWAKEINGQLRNDMNIISSISVTDIVLMIIWGNEIIELFPK